MTSTTSTTSTTTTSTSTTDDDFHVNATEASKAGWFLKRIERLTPIEQQEVWRVTLERRGIVSTAEGCTIGAAIRAASKCH
jgi:hypothetical protein